GFVNPTFRFIPYVVLTSAFSSLREVSFVANDPRGRGDSRFFSRQLHGEGRTFTFTRVHYPEDQVCRVRSLARSSHTLEFDGIIGLANAGRIEKRHRQSAKVEMDFDDAPRRAGIRENDCRLSLRNFI